MFVNEVKMKSKATFFFLNNCILSVTLCERLLVGPGPESGKLSSIARLRVQSVHLPLVLVEQLVWLQL